MGFNILNIYIKDTDKEGLYSIKKVEFL